MQGNKMSRKDKFCKLSCYQSSFHKENHTECRCIKGCLKGVNEEWETNLFDLSHIVDIIEKHLMAENFTLI